MEGSPGYGMVQFVLEYQSRRLSWAGFALSGAGDEPPKCWSALQATHCWYVVCSPAGTVADEAVMPSVSGILLGTAV